MQAVDDIKQDLKERLDVFEQEKKFLEAQRLRERTTYDIEMMLKYLIVLLLISLLNQVTYGNEELKIPDKPSVFKNKQELVNYLKKMNEYYAIVGRARFGKRSSSSYDINAHPRVLNQDIFSILNYKDLIDYLTNNYRSSNDLSQNEYD